VKIIAEDKLLNIRFYDKKLASFCRQNERQGSLKKCVFHQKSEDCLTINSSADNSSALHCKRSQKNKTKSEC